MTITIYIEYFFVVNFFMSYIVIYLTGVFLKTGSIRVKTGALISALIYCINILLFGFGNASNIITVIVGPVIIASVIIPPFEYKKLSMKLITLYTVTVFVGIVMGGIISYTYPGYLMINIIKQNSGLIALAIWMIYGYVLLKFVIKLIRYLIVRFMNNMKICDITLIYEEKVLNAKGLIDSGNNLYYGENKYPVSIVEYAVIKSILCEKPKGLFMINYMSLGQDRGVLYGIVFDKIEIGINGRRISIDKPHIGIYKGKFSGNGEYNMIVHKDYINL